jgi:hypothetical protein
VTTCCHPHENFMVCVSSNLLKTTSSTTDNQVLSNLYTSRVQSRLDLSYHDLSHYVVVTHREPLDVSGGRFPQIHHHRTEDVGRTGVFSLSWCLQLKINLSRSVRTQAVVVEHAPTSMSIDGDDITVKNFHVLVRF